MLTDILKFVGVRGDNMKEKTIDCIRFTRQFCDEVPQATARVVYSACMRWDNEMRKKVISCVQNSK